MIEGVVVAALVVAFAAIAGVAAWTVWRLWTGADPGDVGQTTAVPGARDDSATGHTQDVPTDVDVEAGGRAVDRR